jgi:hypothetical protein
VDFTSKLFVALFPGFVSKAISLVFSNLDPDDISESPARLPAIYLCNLSLHHWVPRLGILLCQSYLTPPLPPIPTFIIFPDTTSHIPSPVKTPLPTCG